MVGESSEPTEFHGVIYDMVCQVVEGSRGDLDKVAAIAKAQVVCGRTLRRLVLLGRDEVVSVERSFTLGIIADIDREDSMPEGGNGNDH